MRRGTPASSMVSEGTCLTYENFSDARPLSARSFYQGCKRLSGPPLPPNGTPTAIPSLERLNERLEHLAFAPRKEGGPPLVTYTTTPGPHGDVVSATDEYIRWFRSNYPNARGGDPVQRGGFGSAAEGAGIRF